MNRDAADNPEVPQEVVETISRMKTIISERCGYDETVSLSIALDGKTYVAVRVDGRLFVREMS